MIQEARDDAAIQRCFPILRELRPHLEASSFLERVRRQQAEHGYRLVYLEDAGQVVSVAGYRFGEFLAWGRVFYVDDLATSAASQRKGFGRALLEWLIARARAEGCDQFHLDSGVQRLAAHGLYHRLGLRISCYHFTLDLQ